MNLGAVFNTLKSVGKVARLANPIVTMIPGYGPVIGAFVNAVFQAEAASPGPGTGAQKATIAQSAIEPDIQMLMKQMQELTGNPMSDPVRFLAYRTKQMEAMVELFHAYGVFDPKAK